MGLNEDQPGGSLLSVSVFHWEGNVWVTEAGKNWSGNGFRKTKEEDTVNYPPS